MFEVCYLSVEWTCICLFFDFFFIICICLVWHFSTSFISFYSSYSFIILVFILSLIPFYRIHPSEIPQCQYFLHRQLWSYCPHSSWSLSCIWHCQPFRSVILTRKLVWFWRFLSALVFQTNVSWLFHWEIPSHHFLPHHVVFHKDPFLVPYLSFSIVVVVV